MRRSSVSRYRDQGPGTRDQGRSRSILLLIPAFIVLPLLVPGPRSPVPESLVWSDPVTVAETAVAAPPAITVVGDRLHLFWLDKTAGATVLRHAVLDAGGRVHGAVQEFSRGVDERAGWPVAASNGDRIAVAWMGSAPGGLALFVAVLDPAGGFVTAPQQLTPAAESSGRVAIVPYAGGFAIAWSQFTDPRRRIWSVQLSRDGRAIRRPGAVADGDGAALSVDQRLRLLWWQPVGFDTYRLMLAESLRLAAARSGPAARLPGGAPRALTGTISLPKVVPVIPFRKGRGSLWILLPIVERGFGTSGRLFQLRYDASGVSPRELATPGFAFDVAAAEVGNKTLVIWSAATGRRRNTEILGAFFDRSLGRLTAEFRISYTISGSIRPAAVSLGGTWAAAWLEISGVGRFRLVLSTSRSGRPATFLLGIPELNTRRPAQMLAFSATVIAAVLPYAVVLAVAFFLPAVVLAVLMAAIFGQFSWTELIRRRRWARFLLFLAGVLALQVVARGFVPGSPGVWLLLGGMVGPAGAGAVLASRAGRVSGELAFWAMAAGGIFVQMIAVLFPWGAGLLSQF
jgi:hypothetical protein